MKAILRVCMLLTLGTMICRAQTADEYVSQGRAFLAARDLANANNRFASAIALSPGHATGNVFRAATRLLVLPTQPAGSNLLNRLGFAQTNRNIYDWTADVARDTNGIPLAPAGMVASEGSAFLRTNVLPEIIAAGAGLAVVETNFTLALTSNETALVAVTLDYGDILLLRSGLKFSEYLIYTIRSWDLDAQLTAVRSLFTDSAVTAQSFLAQNTNLFLFATTNDLLAARAALSNATVLYVEASEFIRNRPTNVTRLFNWDSEMADSEANFRTTLNEVNQSLDGPVVLTADSNITIHAASHFVGTVAPRSFLPQIHGNAIVAGTLPDPTFDGVIQGVPAYRIENVLGHGRYFGTYPDDFHFGGIPFISRFESPQRLMDGRCLITFNQLVGTYFVIQVSTNLFTWSDVAFAASDHGTYSFVDDTSVTGGKRFYRALDVSGSFTLNGAIIDVSTGNPVSGATVLLRFPSLPGSPLFQTYSDWSGSFFLVPSIPLFNSYQVDVIASGYSPVQVGGYGYDHRTIAIYLAPAGYHPPNDDFAQREPILGTNVLVSGYNVSATAEPGEPDHAYVSGGESVWWTWTSPVNGAVTIDTAGSSFAAALAVYTGNSVSGLNLITSDFLSGEGLNSSTVTFFVTAGVAYQIAVDRAFYETSGRIALNLRMTTPVPPTITYQPQSRSELAGSYAGFYVGARGTNPLRYQWRKDGTPINGATNDIYEISSVQTNHAGLYSVQVMNDFASTVSSNAVLTVIPLPPNDAFATRITITGNSSSIIGSNVGATKETGEPYHAGHFGGRSVWWTWTAPMNGMVTVDTVGSLFDTLLAVYTGSSVNALTPVSSDNNSGGNLTSKLSFAASAGTTYQIAVDGWNYAAGNIVLNLSQ